MRTAATIYCHLRVRGSDTGNQIPILCYHRVLPEFREDDYRVFSVSPEQFEAQAAFLAESGFISLSLPEYAEIAGGVRSIPRRAVLITFDDGYADNYALAWQIAQKYNLKINFFICTGIIGHENPVIMAKDGYAVLNNGGFAVANPSVQLHLRRFPELWRPLNWRELQEMHNFGVGIGLHSHTHRNFARLTPSEKIYEIETGLALFKKKLGFSPQFYALPYGGYDSLTPEIIKLLRKYDQLLIFGTHIGRTRLPTTQVTFPRISIFQHDNLVTFRHKIMGSYDWLGTLCQFFSKVQLHLNKGKR
jgi:peptidoglycan/xylan/chitin deacetylase (PgdA/CDA1 family)